MSHTRKALRITSLITLTLLPALLATLQPWNAGAQPCAVEFGNDTRIVRGCRSTVWTAVGSTGVVDESALSIFSTNNAKLGYKDSTSSTAPITARYNVTNVPLPPLLNNTIVIRELTPTPPVLIDGNDPNLPHWNTLELGYFDNSPGSVVSAQLHQVDPCTGAITPLCKATSVDGPSSDCVTCKIPDDTVIDFANFLYFVNVTVDRSATSQKPTANTLRLYCQPKTCAPTDCIEFVDPCSGFLIKCGEGCLPPPPP